MNTNSLRQHLSEASLLWFVTRVSMKRKLSLRRLVPVLKCVHRGIKQARALAVLLPVYRQAVFERYLEEVHARLMGSHFVSRAGGTRHSLDEEFMREIERDVELSPSQSQRFRADVMCAVAAYTAAKHPRPAPHTVHEPLSRGIERYVHRRLVNPHVMVDMLPRRPSRRGC